MFTYVLEMLTQGAMKSEENNNEIFKTESPEMLRKDKKWAGRRRSERSEKSPKEMVYDQSVVIEERNKFKKIGGQ